MTDVAIIGAGPAGSSLALQLARAGFDVTLIERSRFPRTKVCGDYLCAGAIGAMQQLDIAGSVLAGAHAIRSVVLAGFGSQLRLRLPGEGAMSLPRATLDERMLSAACNAGARLLQGSYLSAEEERRLLRVIYRDAHGAQQALNARVLCGADGAWSTVAQRAGMVPHRRRTGRWAVGGQLVNQPDSDELEMYVGPKGYYARNPLSADTTNSMLVLPQPAPLDQADAIVEQMTQGIRRFESEKIERRVAVGPLRYRAGRVANGRILLTGDAAELLDPFTGQGVASAMQLSFPASAAVLALLHGEPAVRVARRYAREWRSIIAPRRALTAFVDAVVRVEFLRQRALRGIRRDAEVAQAVLASVSGVVPASAALAPRTLWQLLR